MQIGNGIQGDLRVVLREVAERLGIETRDARSVHRHSNTVLALPSAGMVLRVAGNPDSLDRVTASVTVTKWLGDRGFPCVLPVDVEQPLVVGRRVVSIWRLVDVTSDTQVTGHELGCLLRTLHDQPKPPFPLRELSDPLAGVARAVELTPGALSRQDRTWLLERIDELRRRWRFLDFPSPPGLIHGDAHPGNVMRLREGGIVLGDWDHVANGPREWDIVQIHYMRRRFHRVTQQDIDEFAATYGWDIRGWDGLRTLVEIRELSGLAPYIRSARLREGYKGEVIYRLRTLRHHDDEAVWNPPGRAARSARLGDDLGERPLS